MKRKILITGLGSIGQRHARNLRALCGDQVELSAYRVRNDARVLDESMQVAQDQGLEAKYEIATYRELDAALDARPDAIFICNPTALHLPVARAAAARGVHLFLEKPISDSMEGLEELARTVDEKRLLALVAFQLRFHPCFLLARKLLAERAVGTVVSARFLVGEWLPGFHPWEDYRQSYAARSDLGGGVVLTLIHELDAAFALFGLPRKVFSLGGHKSALEVSADDAASTLLDCDPVAVHVQQDYLQRPGRRAWDIVGDAGRIEIDLTVPSLRVIDAKGESRVHDFSGLPRNQLFLDELRHFLACLDGKEQPVVSLRQGMASQQIAAAIHQSMRSGKVVALP